MVTMLLRLLIVVPYSPYTLFMLRPVT